MLMRHRALGSRGAGIGNGPGEAVFDAAGMTEIEATLSKAFGFDHLETVFLQARPPERQGVFRNR